MQELIKILEDENHLWNPRNNQDDNDTYLHCIDEAQKLLEKEKEQIVKAFNDGHHADVGHIDKAWEYYNQTYNQNK